MRNEDFLLIQRQQHEDVIRLLEANKTAINAETKASADMVNIKIDEVIKKQDAANGRLRKVESQTVFIRWIGQNPKIAIPILAVFGVGLFFLLQMFGLKIFF